MDSVNLILSVPAIVAIVTLGKSFGIAGKWALLAAVVVGIALSVADYYLGANGAWQAGVQGALIGLSAAGLYDVAKVTRSV
jgi:hypothetical protein